MEQGPNFGGLKVLMISSDRNILTSGSAVSMRMKEYAELVDELHIVLMCDKVHGLQDTWLSTKVWVYPTNSLAHVFRPMGAARIGKRIVSEKKFIRGRSLVTADSIECGWAALKVKKTWRLPLEVQLHSDPFSPYFGGFQNSVRKFYAKKILRSADLVRVVSESVGEEVKKRFSIENSKICVLPIYIDRERIEKGQMLFDVHARYGWKFIMLMVARLTPEKNIGMALEVLAKLRVYYPDAGLVIVGDGREKAALERRSTELHVEQNVVFAGWQEDLVSFYRTSNMFLQTSKFEGYGLSLVEAALSNLALVSTPVGVANEFVNGKDALICPQGDSEFMFKAIYDLINNDSLRALLRVNGKNAIAAKLLSKEDYLKKLLENWELTAARISA